jgi:hypothetical protein
MVVGALSKWITFVQRWRGTSQFIFMVLRSHVSFFVLSLLSKANPPLSLRTTQRFARSAAKRDPKLALPVNMTTILASGAFQPEFCLGKRGVRMSRAAAIRTYLSQLKSGIDPRKPEPGFHPQIFADLMAHKMVEGVDPYAAFLRLGRPTGPWLVPVITGGDTTAIVDAKCDLRTALHIHAFYIEQLVEIAARLALNSCRPDLFVSVRDETDAAIARKGLSVYAGKVVEVAVFPNAGRDIGPMLTGFGPVLVRDYDVIGHCHTKKSTFANDSKWVADWVNYSLSNLLGSKDAGPIADHILAAMQGDAQIGLAYPDDPHIPGWGCNLDAAKQLAVSLQTGPLPKAFNFPVGTMFWIRSGALKPFVDLGLTWSDYPAEPLAKDGTMLHALERLFGAVPPQAGWKTIVTHTPGIWR